LTGAAEQCSQPETRDDEVTIVLFRFPALLAAAALAFQAVPAIAQSEASAEATEAQRQALGQSSFFRSDLILMLGAIAAAVLVNVVLIAADGDDEEPVSP
jgi:hypothetical protein